MLRMVLLTIALAGIGLEAAAPPAGWKKLTDRHDKCEAYVPPDWSIDAQLGSGQAPGHAAGIMMNSNQTQERADRTWAFYTPQMEILENAAGHRVGKMKTGGKGVSYVVQSSGNGFVCNAFVEVDSTGDMAKYGEGVRQVAESVRPQK